MNTERVSRGLTLITLGGILLAMALGSLPWSAWWGVLSLWPLLLVSAGIDVIGRATHQTGLRLLASLVIIGGLLYGVLVAPGGIGASHPTGRTAFSYSEPHAAQIKTGTALISGGAGKVLVSAGSTLASAQGSAAGGARLDVRRTDDTARVEAVFNEGTVVWPGTRGTSLDVRLDRDVAWGVTLKTGACDLDADLVGLRLSAFALHTGASESRVTLGMPAEQASDAAVPVTVKSGVSSIEIRMPRSAAARIRVEGALNAVEARAPFKQTSAETGRRAWETPGYNGTGPRYDIVVKAALGSVRVVPY